LAAAVYEAVVAAGMSFPFPQREVRVLRDGSANEKDSSAERLLTPLKRWTLGEGNIGILE
jgi:hypothetical protein